MRLGKCSNFSVFEKADEHQRNLYLSISQTFLLADPFWFKKSSQGFSHPYSRKYSVRVTVIQNQKFIPEK
jgi:hypothetical protein